MPRKTKSILELRDGRLFAATKLHSLRVLEKMEEAIGLLDHVGKTLKDVLSQGNAKSTGALFSEALANTNLGNLQGLVAKLQQGGLKDQVSSWLGKGANAPVTEDQLRTAIGSEQVKNLAEQFGVSTDDALKLLAKHLPDVVEKTNAEGAPPAA